MSVILGIRLETLGCKQLSFKLGRGFDIAQLDRIATRAGVTTLTEYMAAEQDARNEIAPLENDALEKGYGTNEITEREADRRLKLIEEIQNTHGRWFDIEDGLATVDALLAHHKHDEAQPPVNDLQELRRLLAKAQKHKRRFRLYLNA